MAVFRVFSGVAIDEISPRSFRPEVGETFTVGGGQITVDREGNTLVDTDRFSILVVDTTGETDFDGDDTGADGVNDIGTGFADDLEQDQLSFIVDGNGVVLEDNIDIFLEGTFDFTIGGTTFVGFHFETTSSGPGDSIDLIVLPAGVPDGVATVTAETDPVIPDAIDYSSIIQGDQDVDIGNFTAFEDHTVEEDTLEGGTGSDTFDGGFLNDSLDGSAGDDSLTGNFGQDTLIGGDGADTLIGDNDTVVIDRQVFSWETLGLTTGDPIANGTFDAGLVDFDFDFTAGDQTATSEFSNAVLAVDNIVDDGNAVQTQSSLQISGDGLGGTNVGLLTMSFTPDDSTLFESNVENVSFNITDLDDTGSIDQITVTAFDADNNQIAVTLTLSATTDLLSSDTDTLAGDDTASSQDDNVPSAASDADHAVTIDVAGPVSRIEISFDNIGTADAQNINVTDVYFDVVTNETSAFDDSIDGGTGTDSIDAGEGADTVDGGADADTISGGIGDDVITGGAGSDTIDAGAGDDALTGDEDDTLTGGTGADEFIITDQDASAINITDFDDATGITGAFDTDQTVDQTDNDFVDLSGFFSNLRDARAADTLAGANAELDLGGGQTLTVTGLASADFTFETTNLVCFARDTQILTQNGEKAVQDLSVGDQIETQDNGLQAIRWIGSRLAPAAGALAPIAFAAGVIGNDKVLRVSPLHRILIQGWRAEMLFGEREVLVAAKHLVNGDSVYVDAGGVVEYHHILFDNHEIIYAHGVPTESLHPGRESIDGFGAEAREEIFTLFPELRGNVDGYGPLARSCLKGYEAKVLSDNPGFLS